MAWRLDNFRRFDISSGLTLSIDGWAALTIHNDIAYISHAYPNKWMMADVDANDNFSNFRRLDLSSHLTSFADEWETVVFRGTKAYFVNWRHAHWYMADVDSSGNFSNFVHTDMSGTLTTTPTKGWADLVFFENKVFFLHAEAHKQVIADIPNNWDGDLRHLTNYRNLNFRGSLPDNLDTMGIVIRDGKALFSNIDSNQFATADVSDAGVFSNFQTYDLSSKLTASRELWGNVAFYNNKAIFVNNIRDKWMIADIIDDTPSGGGTGGGTVTPTPIPTVDPNAWHYGDGSGGPHATKNDWKGTFSSHDKQVEFEAIKDSISAHGFDNEGSITAISLPNVTTIDEYAFFRSNFITINLPKVYSIGNNALTNTVNSRITEVTLPDLFDTDADKNRIFGENGWQRITFHWLHNALPANTIWWNGKVQDTQFEMDGKTVEKIIWLETGKECVLKAPGSPGIIGNFGDFEDYNVQLPSGTPTIYWSGSFLFKKKIIFCGSPGGSSPYWMVGDVPGDGTVTNIRKLTVPFTSGYFQSISIRNGKAYFVQRDGNFKIADVDDDLNFTNVKDLRVVLPSVSNSSWESMAFVGDKAVISNLNGAILAVGDVAADGSLSNFVKRDQTPWKSTAGFRKVIITGNKLLVVSSGGSKWLTADIDNNGNITNQKLLDLSSKLTKGSGYSFISVEPLGNGKVLAINVVTSDWMIGDGS